MAISSRVLNRLSAQLQDERRTVSFDSYDLSVRQLLEMFSGNEISIPPEYQRQFVWDVDRQSQLVESIFLGIPVPSLFMATNSDSTWEVVDGVQRLSTIAHFVGSQKLLERIDRDNPLAVDGLDKLEALNGAAFEDLPRTIQLMFETRPLRVTVLNDKSDRKVRFDLFERLNTGGVSLTPQEIRNCVFRGPYNDDVKRLSANDNFSSVITLKPRDEKNGTKEEFVLRFFAFLNGYEEFDHSVIEFLNDFIEENSDSRIPRAQRELFEKTFELLNEELPNGIHRGARSLTPVNVYEAIAVGTALAIRDAGVNNVRRDRISEVMQGAELRRFTAAGTNSRRMVVGRINLVRDELL